MSLYAFMRTKQYRFLLKKKERKNVSSAYKESFEKDPFIVHTVKGKWT